MSKFPISSFAKLSFFALGLALFSSCATTGRHDSLMSLPSSKRIETIGLVIKAQAPEAQVAIPEIEKHLVSKFQGAYRITTPRQDLKDPGYATLTLVIEDFNQVGKASRLFLGILAGKDRIQARGTFTDSRGKIGEFLALGETVEGGLFGPTGTERVAQVIANEMEAFLRGN